MDHRGLRPGRGARDAARHPPVLPPRGNLGRQARAPDHGHGEEGRGREEEGKGQVRRRQGGRGQAGIGQGGGAQGRREGGQGARAREEGRPRQKGGARRQTGRQEGCTRQTPRRHGQGGGRAGQREEEGLSQGRTRRHPQAGQARHQEEGMKLVIVAVGQKVPDWAQTAYDDYAKRFPPELRVELKAVKTEPRGSKTTETLWAAERQRIEAAIPRGARVVALDERGTTLTTQALAQQLRQWQLGGDDVVLVIGGPDGLDPAFREGAHQRIRLSDLTLPHAMVRVLLIEQLYRAWSINANHPYHRE